MNFKTLIAAALCAGATSAFAQLAIQVTDINVFPDTVDSGTVLISETNETLFFDVFFSDELYDFTGDTPNRPELEIQIGGQTKLAQFVAVFEDIMIFRYSPMPGDYGTGFTIKNVTSPSARTVIRLNGVTIRDPANTAQVYAFNQYSQALAAAINANAFNQTIGLNTFRIETDTVALTLDRGATVPLTIKRPNAAAANQTTIALLGSSANTSVATVAPSPNAIQGGSPFTTFYVTGVSPGSTVIRVSAQSHPAEFLEIPVTVQLTGNERAITFTPPEVRVLENAQSPRTRVRVTLGIAPTADVTLDVTKFGMNVNRLTCASTVTILAGQLYRDFDIYAPDGDVNALLTFSDPLGNYETARLEVVVENVPPSIVLPVPTLDPNTQQLRAERTVVAGETLVLNAAAFDPAGTNDVVSFRWVYTDANNVQQTINGPVGTFVFDRDSTITLYASDDDGGDADPLYISVIVETGLLLTLTPAPFEFRGLRGVGTGTFQYVNPSNVQWDPIEGNRFAEHYQVNGVRVQAIPDPGSYLFTWIADEGISESARTMPGNVPYVTIALAETLDVIHLFSREYYVGIDGFGDVDLDGLSDRWEGAWFGVGTSEDFTDNAAVISQGAYGARGNSDDDYLPLAGFRAVPNVLDGGLVEVYEYPITNHGGDLWNWTGYLPNSQNPFVNLVEYRGLREDRAGNGTWIRYAEALPEQNSPQRGNAPASDPTVADTDEDGMDDGWEYYFWSTILYEVNTQNWRAWDPSFNFYDPDDTSEAGLPLLYRGLPDQTITDALPNAYAGNGMGSAFSGTVTNVPVRPGTFTFTFDDGTVYTDAGKGRLNQAISVLHPYTGQATMALVDVLTINYSTGEWTVVPPPDAIAGEDYVITYEMLDGLYTKQQLLDAFDPALAGDPMRDTDGDGLYDWEEFLLGTNPLHWDTDGDGMPDGWEVARGLDPLIGDRVLGHASGAVGNPDGDKMVPGHAMAYLTALRDQTYWNGERAFGFNPNLGWQEWVPDEPDFTNLHEFRVAEYYVMVLDLVDEVGPDNWLQWTTDPTDNDTNANGMPDGWLLYVGVNPILVGPPTIDIPLGFILDPADWDDDGLTLQEEFANVTVTAYRAADETVVIDGVTARRRAFPNPNPAWTNKTRPTDPWNADTDGDGLPDGLEYRELPEFDMNADGSTLVNLDPTSVDTDGDWLPDGWEYYHGLQTTENASPDFFRDGVPSPTGPYGDPDGDGLANFQEYLVGVNYGWRYDKRYAPEDEQYWLPGRAVPGGEVVNGYETDPYDSFFRPYDAFDFLRPFPSPAALQRRFELLESLEAAFGIMPPPPADPAYDYTYLEILQRVIVIIQQEGFLALDPGVIASMLTYETNLRNAHFSHGLQPLAWDSSFYAIPPPIAMPYFFLKEQVPGLYATTHPRNIDSDGDGMDDYWEVFHGINPIYGGDRLPVQSQNDLMLGIVGLNLAMSPGPAGLRPYARAGHEHYRLYQAFSKWRPYDIPEPVGPAYNNLYLNTAIPYDLVNNPALSGCPWGDIDKDGLNNREEAFNLYAADVQHHTDPSPYWLTDISYYGSWQGGMNGAGSHVNLYYSSGSLAGNWWWNYAYNGYVQPAPTYLFDFEVNEGFDTDNNNISDREELTGTDLMGVTDPLDFDNPRSRKAMYFDGYAATRTRNPYLHDKWALTSYTVEMWFRAETPVGQGPQTLIERPVAVPVDSPNTAWAIRRTFRLSITNAGRLLAEVDNDAGTTVSAETTLQNGLIAPNVWYHVAVAMDSQANRFKIYLNGNLLASVQCDIKPCTGYFPGSQIADYDPPASSDVNVVIGDGYMFSPAPIVVGASDNNPGGVVAGPPNDPNLTRFFKGWVDEIRIWDRVRTQSQIQQDLYKRYGKDEVAAVNDARFAWDMDHAITATALTQFPQKILYHFTFDNLPDVIASPDRDPLAMIPSHDTDPLPAGYDSPAARLARPPVTDYPGVPWWFNSGVRSTVYSSDYTYVPFIQNTAAHLRQYPPFDISTIRPVFDANYNLLGYRWRRSEDWLAMMEDEMAAWDPVDPDNPYDIHPDLLPNSANPYAFRYMTGISGNYEIHPMAFNGMIGLLSQYERLPIHTDMLPLLNAVADIDVDLWDGLGAGSNFAALDSDGDGLPDWWEIANGLDPYDPTGINGAYGDPDGDGLDNWGEYMAGTDPWSVDTNGDGYSDYYSRDDNWSLTYGELYDDGDGMPNDWEVLHGLNPNRYDAHEDLDNDGWTNYEEYLAGTLPNSAFSYPVPSTQFTIYYDGDAEDIPSMIVHTFSEAKHGETMGGRYDAHLSTHRNVAGDSGYLGTDGLMRFQDYQVPVSYLAYGKIELAGATITVRVPNADGTFTEQTMTLQPFNEEMGVFEGGTMDHRIFLFYAPGALWPLSGFFGMEFTINYTHGWEFPVTVRNPIVASGSHIRGGYNRFFGFLDLNGDGLYTTGEPAGLSLTRPVLVSYDSLSAEIACTDQLTGYPRISWPASTSGSTNPYRIDFQSAGSFVGTFYVQKPRSYFHEGDLLAQNMLGMNFGAATSGAFSYTVSDGADVVSTGSVTFDLGTNAGRRRMKARYPVQLEKVYGNVVKFEWEMDYRNAGATMQIVGIDDGITYYNETIPLPLRRGKVTDNVYYYTATPQTMDGKRYVNLPAGRYQYTITEFIRSTGITKQSITERFQVVKEEGQGREIYSISGNISYFGRAETAEDVVALHVFDGVETGHAGTVPGTTPISPGTISLQVVNASGRVVESLSDSRADGALLSQSGTALSGRIYYDSREYTVEFADPMPAGYTLRIAYKYFLKPIVIEAFKLSDQAQSCFAVAGTPVARVVQYVKGKYTINGLAPGKYAIRAYLDSNNTRTMEYWETSGIAVNGATQGPVVYTTYPPIQVPTSQVGMDIVLRDKDTDNDLLPDAWEYQHFGNLTAKSGYDQNQPDLYIWQEYADGELDSDPNRIDTDGDGLSDAIELNLTKTDTHLVDTDFDGVSDLEEFLSGSDPLDPDCTTPYKTLGVEFDADGRPFVRCPHPDLVRGIVISYILKYKADLSDPEWVSVYEEAVSAPDITQGHLPAGTLIMKPDVEDVDWHNGFFKIDVEVDYGEWTFN